MTPRPGYDPASLFSGVIVIVLGGLLLLDQADVLEATGGVPVAARAGRARRHPARVRARRSAARALVGDCEHPSSVTIPQARPAPLRRDRSSGVLGGVCAGVGQRLGIDPLILRIGFVVAAAIGGAGVLRLRDLLGAAARGW